MDNITLIMPQSVLNQYLKVNHVDRLNMDITKESYGFLNYVFVILK